MGKTRLSGASFGSKTGTKQHGDNGAPGRKRKAPAKFVISGLGIKNRLLTKKNRPLSGVGLLSSQGRTPENAEKYDEMIENHKKVYQTKKEINHVRMETLGEIRSQMFDDVELEDGTVIPYYAQFVKSFREHAMKDPDSRAAAVMSSILLPADTFTQMDQNYEKLLNKNKALFESRVLTKFFKDQLIVLLDKITQRKIICGGRRCFASGTRVLKSDTSWEYVDNLKVGDKLLGPDGTERTIIETHSGVSQLYKIDFEGITFEVNEDHILHTDKGDIDVKTYISLPEDIQSLFNLKKLYGYVYMTTNLINGKRYIGQHKFVREKNIYYGSGLNINRALKKYGHKAFKKEILAMAISKEELSELEIKYISELKPEYNIDPGGAVHTKKGKTGRSIGSIPWNKGKKNVYTKEQLERISIGVKKGQSTHIAKQNMSRGNTNRWINATKEQYLKWCNSAKNSSTPERNKKISNSLIGHIPINKGKHFNKETRHYE